jgi:lysylphosphatidylglycerol synthetase-like protein (DUF2156 family)
MGEEPTGGPGAGQRLAALVALGCVAAAAALVLAEVVRNFLALLVAALSLILCVVAAWYVVSRRGPARLAAGVIMAAALGLVISSLLFADIRVWRVALAAALSLLSVALARYALRRSRGALKSGAGQPGSPAPPRPPTSPPCRRPGRRGASRAGSNGAQAASRSARPARCGSAWTARPSRWTRP